MKVRVIEHDGLYYPQYKIWLVWHYFEVDCPHASLAVYFTEEKEAINYCKDKIKPKTENVIWSSN